MIQHRLPHPGIFDTSQRPKKPDQHDASFLMGGEIFGESNDCGYDDVLTVLRALTDWVEERRKNGEKGVSYWFWLVDEGGQRNPKEVGYGHLRWLEGKWDDHLIKLEHTIPNPSIDDLFPDVRDPSED